MDHASRRARLAARLADFEVEAILVTRLPNVRWLTGFTGSNGQLLLGAEGAVFLTDGRYVEQSRHEVPDLPRMAYAPSFPATFHRATVDLGVRRVAFESAGLSHRSWIELGEGSAVELVPTVEEVERLRWVKTAEEIELLGRAQAIADDAFDAVTARLATGTSERGLAFELDSTMRLAGAESVSFDTIVAFGENSAEPHHVPTDRPLAPGDLVKLDFGATVDGYHSDMTRTVAFGRIDPRLEEIYEIVRDAQRAGVEAVRAGASGGTVDGVVRERIGAAGHAEHYPHSLGHGVGLEVHEGPSLRPAGDDVLPEGTVVTVEPGIYVPGLGGVRIEDMVEVTAGDPRVLPRTTKELVVL